MTTLNLTNLVVETILRPRDAANRLLNLGVSRNTLWMALLLATVLNALLSSLSNFLFPAPQAFQGLVGNPMLYAMALAGALVITVFVLTWVGNMLGGQGQLGDVLVVLVWMQFMRVLAQAVIIVLVLAVPTLGGLMSLVIFGLSIWILLHFLNAAHQFNSLGKTFLVLLLTGLGVSFGLSILLTLIGVSAEGIVPNV